MLTTSSMLLIIILERIPPTNLVAVQESCGDSPSGFIGNDYHFLDAPTNNFGKDTPTNLVAVQESCDDSPSGFIGNAYHFLDAPVNNFCTDDQKYFSSRSGMKWCSCNRIYHECLLLPLSST